MSKECRAPRRFRRDELNSGEEPIARVEDDRNHGRVGGVFGEKLREQEVYVKAIIDGREHICLLDSGCMLSILPAEVVENKQTLPTNFKIKAANNVSIPVVGEIEVVVEIGTLQLNTRFLVSNHVSEIMLRYDFFKDNDIVWSFKDSTISIQGQSFRTCAAPSVTWNR